MTNKVWISWEDHRRSRELSDALGAAYYPLVKEGSRAKRYVILGFRTLNLLLKLRPKYVFCQNPSIVLTTIVVILRHLLGFKVVVDRHSNFKFEYSNDKTIKWVLFNFLSRFTIRNADLTIVTNSYLKSLCEKLGGRTLILQDKLPSFPRLNCKDPKPNVNIHDDVFKIMAVTMFDDDEPIDELISAGKCLPSNYIMYLTGNFNKMYTSSDAKLLIKDGVFLTGFISEAEYQSLMYNADVVVVLTKKDHILNCGAYEAFSMRKPLVLSDTIAIREYFSEGCLYTKAFSKNIADSIMEALTNSESLVVAMTDFIPRLESSWEKRFTELKLELEKI